jgi:hypothetical protein
MWILGSARRDGLWFYLPGLLTIVLSLGLDGGTDSWPFILFAFVAQGILDSGHVYTTLWRTYFDPRERRRLRMYLWAPPVIFAVVFGWGALGLPFLGAVVLYATVFHNVRQFYGLSKWYQRLAGVSRPVSDRFLYLLCGLPFVMAHFRPGVEWPPFYRDQEALVRPDVRVFSILAVIYCAALLGWATYEWFIWRREGRREFARLLSVAYPVLLYGFAFLRGTTLAQILFPLVVSHGLTYIALTSLSLVRTRGRAGLGRPAVAVIAVAATAALFGTIETIYENRVAMFDDPRLAFFLALYLMPLFCHYLFDAFLWTRRHPDAAVIFAINRPDRSPS